MSATQRPYALRIRYHFPSGNLVVVRRVSFATEAALLAAATDRLTAAVAATPSARRIDAVIDGPTIPGLAGQVLDVNGTRTDLIEWVNEQARKARAVLASMGRDADGVRVAR